MARTKLIKRRSVKVKTAWDPVTGRDPVEQAIEQVRELWSDTNEGKLYRVVGEAVARELDEEKLIFCVTSILRNGLRKFNNKALTEGDIVLALGVTFVKPGLTEDVPYYKVLHSGGEIGWVAADEDLEKAS